MFFLRKKKKTAIGLDIGYSSVKGIELSDVGGSLVADRFACVPIEQPGDSSKRGESVVKAIREVHAQGRFSTKRVVAAVNGESVIVRVLRLPYFEEKERGQLDFAVRTEARDFIPFDMEDVAFDYQRLGAVEEGHEGRALEVLIVAAQRDLVRWHTEVLKAAGMEPRVVDVGSFALVNAVRYGADFIPETPVALVDVGAALTNIAIMKGETTRFTRDLSTAGATVTRAIMAELGIDEKSAESAKIQHGISLEEDETGGEEILTISQTNLPETFGGGRLGESADADEGKQLDQKVHAICEQYLGEIASEIKRCLLFYENQLDGEPVEKVFLTGGTVQMRNADRYVENLLDTTTEILDPFTKISGAVQSLDPLTRGATYATCLGLALRSVIGEGVT